MVEFPLEPWCSRRRTRQGSVHPKLHVGSAAEADQNRADRNVGRFHRNKNTPRQLFLVRRDDVDRRTCIRNREVEERYVSRT